MAPPAALVPSSSSASTQRLQKQAREQLSRFLVQALSKLGLSSNTLASGGLLKLLGAYTPRMWTVVKALIGLLFVLNWRSWPMVWHVRIWYWAILKRLQYKAFRWSNAFSSKADRAKREDEWVEKSLGGMGHHPFDFVSVYKSWASLDESDFNMHLSNSSYAKTLDAARFKVAMEIFLNFFRGGGWLPLAATQYHFICEIPILANYEVRSRIGGWDEKWFYVVSKFVVPANKSKKKAKAAASKNRRPDTTPNSSGSSSPGGNPDGMPSLRTPSCGEDVNSTLPSGAATPFAPSSSFSTTNNLAAVDAGLKVTENTSSHPLSSSTAKPKRIAEIDEFDVEEADGAQVHTVAISRCCFKVGRMTVPPRLVFALCGLTAERPPSSSTPSSSSLRSKFVPSAESPRDKPSHWEAVKKTLNPNGRVGEHGTYDPRALAKLMKGGWKEVDEGKEEEERWWDNVWKAEDFGEEMKARVERLGRRL